MSPSPAHAPNNWQLDKDISLLRQDVQRVEQTQADHGEVLFQIRDYVIAKENQTKGATHTVKILYAVVSFLGGLIGGAASWIAIIKGN